MYEALIRDLRNCCGIDTLTCDCDNCGFKELAKEGDYTECADALGVAAADAIENMNKVIARQKDMINGFAYIPLDYQWFPVKKKLPDPMHNVLVTDGKDIGIGWIFSLHSNGEVSWAAPFADIDGRDVTHWMPLPKLPKEEK